MPNITLHPKGGVGHFLLLTKAPGNVTIEKTKIGAYFFSRVQTLVRLWVLDRAVASRSLFV